jgi:anti-anti-sigma regulatory factor
MEINVSVHQAEEPVAVMQIQGNIDASNFLEVISRAQEIYKDTARNLILDLSEVPYVSSAGLVAIHKIALLYSEVPQEENLSPDYAHSNRARRHVKLLHPQPAVDQILETAGLKLFFKVFDDLESALQSF